MKNYWGPTLKRPMKHTVPCNKHATFITKLVSISERLPNDFAYISVLVWFNKKGNFKDTDQQLSAFWTIRIFYMSIYYSNSILNT